jgi:hypothetical protein
MRYLKCKCGKCERWDSGEAVHACEGCNDCKTTFASAPEYHKPLEAHVLVPTYDENTGEVSGQRCKVCHHSVKA